MILLYLLHSKCIYTLQFTLFSYLLLIVTFILSVSTPGNPTFDITIKLIVTFVLSVSTP